MKIKANVFLGLLCLVLLVWAGLGVVSHRSVLQVVFWHQAAKPAPPPSLPANQ